MKTAKQIRKEIEEKAESGWYFVKRYDSDYGCDLWGLELYDASEYAKSRFPFNDGVGMRYKWEGVKDMRRVIYPED